jgi:hypothetical protein
MSEVRATRAYLAGFGTAGSLLAGAALLFVLASAYVSFVGWPKVGGAPRPASVVVSPQFSSPHATATSQRLALAAARAAGGASRATALIGGAALRVHHRGAPVTGNLPGALSAPNGGFAGSGGTAGSGARAGASATGSGAGGAGGTGGATGGGGGGSGGPTGPIQQIVQQASSTITGTISSSGSQLGSTITGTSGTVANQLPPSTPAPGTVSSAGSTAAGAVTSATSTTAGAVSGATQTATTALGSLGH